MDKVLKNSTPGKIAYILQIERVQPDAISFERTQIHFLSDVFTAAAVVVVVVVDVIAYAPYLCLLKLI